MSVRIHGRDIDAVVFDLDGVVTDTASTHAAAWKRLFDDYLRARAERTGRVFQPFDANADYRLYVDGKPRYDGVRDFLRSRGIDIPYGSPSDAADAETVCGLGNRKNALFLDVLARQGAAPYPTTIRLIRRLRALGVPVALISSSRNAEAVLRAAGALDLFDARVDGVEAERLDLPGKPDPAVFLEAAARLGIPPGRAAIVEDALAGVDAGRRGGFALVIGVDRAGQADDLRRSGADIVVADLGELEVVAGGPAPTETGRA